MKIQKRVWIKIAGVLLLSLANTFAGWSLVWSDEFDQPDGASPDSTKWVFDLGGGGWGNDELETYTSRTNNVRIEGGQLVIEAKRETFIGTDGIQRDYTSGRLKTKGKAAWTCGRMEARIKIPRGQGIWPAFWMLGNNVDSVGWPTCGEIDIMENIGREPTLVHGTIHGPGYSGGGGIGGPCSLTNGAAFADDFHVFAIEWETNRIRWFVDNQLYFTATPASLPAGTTWVFTAPQFILLDLAVGGIWPGYPDGTTVMPQRMLIDYVRVYAPNAIVDVSPTQDWIGYMNVFDLNNNYQWGSGWGLADLRANFDLGTGLLTLSPNTNVYNASDPYWANPDGSGAKIMDASCYVENPDLAGTLVTFSGHCWVNTLAAGYSCKAFIKDFSPDYSSVTTTNVALVGGQPFNLSMATTAGDHIQYGFETIGRDASPATVATLGAVVVASVPPPSPVVVIDPISITNNAGTTATFTISGNGATAYQWYKGTNALSDSQNVAGANASSLTLSNVLAAASGDYKAVLSYYSASTTSAVATLTVIDPFIAVSPSDQSVKAGSSALFTVSAVGTGLTYQWKQNGTNAPFASARTSTLTVAATAALNGYAYSVVVSNALGDFTTSGPATLTVLPSKTDTNAPLLNITFPKKNSETPLRSVVITGTATDNVRVSSVLVSLNGDAFAAADVTNGVQGAATWGIPVTLNAGTNTLSVKAVDTLGNSRSTNIQFFCQVPSAFTILPNVGGAGTVTIIPPLPAYVGRNYFITAKPDANSVLSNVINVASSGTSVFPNASPLRRINKIAITAELTNDVVVNFLTNRFLSAAGNYYGLFGASDVKQNSSGLLIIKVTPQMTFSGSMYLDGDLLKNIKGVFGLSGQSEVTVFRANGKSAVGLHLRLGFDKTLTGSVDCAAEGWVSEIDADQAVFSGKAPASTFVGKYTMLLPGFGDSQIGPSGYGYSLVSIISNGQILSTGFTADNQPLVSIAVPVSTNGRWPFFARQYATSSNYNGSVIGWVEFVSNSSTSTFSGDLHWIKRGWTNGLYDGGFTNDAQVIGSAFVAPAKLPFTTATATFSGAELVGSFDDQLTVSNGVALKTANATPVSKNYVYGARSGVLTAKGTNSPAVLNFIRGCYLQNQRFIGGYFIGVNRTGKVTVQ